MYEICLIMLLSPQSFTGVALKRPGTWKTKLNISAFSLQAEKEVRIKGSETIMIESGDILGDPNSQ